MCEYVYFKESHVNSDIFSLEVLLLWKLCYIDHIWDFQIRVCSSTWLIVDLTLGYQSAPLVMPSGNGYFRQAELFLIPEDSCEQYRWTKDSYTGELKKDSYTGVDQSWSFDHGDITARGLSFLYWVGPAGSLEYSCRPGRCDYAIYQHYDYYHHHDLILPGLFWA